MGAHLDLGVWAIRTIITQVSAVLVPCHWCLEIFLILLGVSFHVLITVKEVLIVEIRKDLIVGVVRSRLAAWLLLLARLFLSMTLLLPFGTLASLRDQSAS